MNYLKLLLFLSLGVGVISSCQKESEILLHESPQKRHSESLVSAPPKSEQDALNIVALSLLKSSQKDEAFTSKLSKLSEDKFDGDFDYLAVKLYDGSELRSIEQGVSFSLRESMTELLGKNASNTISEISQKYPLINIYTPFSEKDFLSAKDFLIVVDNLSGKDDLGYNMSAFNKKGEKVFLSSNEEPKIPYIVVGRNERVEAYPNNTLRSLNSTYHKNKTHSFSLKKGFSNIEEKSSLRSLSENAGLFNDLNEYRSIGDRDTYDYISKAEFMSKSALQRVEGWSRGQPEVVLTIFYDSILENGSETQIYNNKYKLNVDLGEEGWYSGSRSWLKPGRFKVRTNTTGWTIVRWGVVAKPTQMRYYFVEEDGKFEVKVSYKGVKVEFDLMGSADFIGETIIDFYDSLPREYPMGNTFKFTLDLRKVR